MNTVRLGLAADTERARCKARAESDYAMWFERGERHLESFILHRNQGHYRHASYELFQAAEAFYGALLLVFVGEKPWSHDIRMFQRTAVQCDPLFAHVFADEAEDERLLMLLYMACMGARYDRQFSVSKGNLRRLHRRVKLLRDLVERICRSRLQEL